MKDDRSAKEVLLSIEEQLEQMNERLLHNGSGVAAQVAGTNAQLGQIKSNLDVGNGMDSSGESEDGTSDSERVEEPPWEGLPVTMGQYTALKTVFEASGTPKYKTLNEGYAEKLDTDPRDKDNGPKISPRLSELYGEGYVDRTPNQPFRYWVTDKGKELLDK
jgi:hypothetical protein